MGHRQITSEGRVPPPGAVRLFASFSPTPSAGLERLGLYHRVNQGLQVVVPPPQRLYRTLDAAMVRHHPRQPGAIPLGNPAHTSSKP